MSSSSSYHYPDEVKVNQYGVPYFKPGSCFAFQAWLRVLNREFRIRGLVYHIKTLTNEDPVVPEKPEGGWSMYGQEVKDYEEWKKNDALAFDIIWMSLDPSVRPITPEDMTAKQLYDDLIDRYGKIIRPEIQLKLRDFLNTPKDPDQSMAAYCISKEDIFYELNHIEGKEVLDPGLLRQMIAQGLPRQQAYVPLRARLLDLDQGMTRTEMVSSLIGLETSMAMRLKGSSSDDNMEESYGDHCGYGGGLASRRSSYNQSASGSRRSSYNQDGLGSGSRRSSYIPSGSASGSRRSSYNNL